MTTGKLGNWILGALAAAAFVYVGLMSMCEPVKPRVEAGELANAKLMIMALCYRVQTEHDVNLTYEDYRRDGGDEDMIRLARQMLELKREGEFEGFVRYVADSNRNRCGPVPKKVSQ